MRIKNNRERVRIHRVERYDNGEFQQTGRFEWHEASNKLTYGGFKLWLWLADNCNGYEYDLSPTAIKNALKMPDNTYCRAKQNLIDNGYLVSAEDGWFDYYMYGRPDWHLGDTPYFQNGSIKYLDTSKMEGQFTSKMEGTFNFTSKMEDKTTSKMEGIISEFTSKMEGEPSKMEGNTSKMEGKNADLLPFWGDKYITNIQISNLNTDGHPSDTLDGNFVSSEHPSGAASPEAKQSAEETEKKKKQKDGKSTKPKYDRLEDKTVSELMGIVDEYNKSGYDNVYDMYNLRRGSLNFEKISEYIPQLIDQKKREGLTSSLDSDASLNRKICKYLDCSESDVKGIVSELGIKPDDLVACFEDSEVGHMFVKEYWQGNEYSKDNYGTHSDWIKSMWSVNGGDIVKRMNESIESVGNVESIVISDSVLTDVDDGIDWDWLY